MKILFINPYYPPWAPGGAEHSLEQMCMQLSRKGLDVQVLAAAFDERALDERKSGYSVRWARAPFSIQHGQDINAELYLRTNQFSKLISERFHQIESPDLIVANNAQVYEVVKSLGRQAKVPTIAIVRDTQMLCEFGTCMDNHSAMEAAPCHGYLKAGSCSISFQRVRGVSGWRPLPAWFLGGIKMHWRRLRLRSIIREIDHIVTISDALNTLVRKALPKVAPNDITTIRNFTTIVKPAEEYEVIRFLKQHDLNSKKFFLFAGRKTYGKGADLLIQATDMIREEIIGFKSLLLGRGSISGGTNVGCIDIDSVPQNYLLGLLAHSTALVIPGRWQEGLHRTMIDAIYAGIPIICTNVGAPPVDGVIDGCNGYIVPSNDCRALASAMIRLSGWTAEEREKCRIASERRFRSHFTSDKLVTQWTELFENLLKTKG